MKTQTHTHEFTKIGHTELRLPPGKARNEADKHRAEMNLAPYDYGTEDRILLHKECECGKRTTIDLLHRDAAAELYKRLKETTT